MPAGTAKTRATKAAAAEETDVPLAPEPTDTEQEPDAPTVVEGQVADKPKETLGAFQATFAAFKATVLAQVDGKIEGQLKPVQQSIDDLADMVRDLAQKPSDVAVTEEEDYFGDKLAEFRGELNALADGRVTRNELSEVVDLVKGVAEQVKITQQQVAARPVNADGTAGPPVKAVYGQVLELMKLVEEIGKGGTAKYGAGKEQAEYKFRGIDAAMNAVGTALRQVGLIMRSEVVEQESSFYDVEKIWDGKKTGMQRWATTRVVMRYTFVSPIDGSEHFVEGLGVGKDFGDKDGSKAASAAMKYALFQGLCIPVKGMNVDPESESADSADPAYQGNPPPEHYDEGPPADYNPEQATTTRPDAGQQREGRPPIERAYAALEKATTRAEVERIRAKAEETGILQVQYRGRPFISHCVAKRSTLPADAGSQNG